MKIVFASQSRSDLLEIVQTFAWDKPNAAKNGANSIKTSINKTDQFPQLGRVVPEFSNENIREIIKGQYRVVYKIDEKNKNIVILTIHHSRRNLW